MFVGIDFFALANQYHLSFFLILLLYDIIIQHIFYCWNDYNTVW